MGEQKVMCASLALAELEQAKIAGRALLREQFGKLFEEALKDRRESLAKGHTLASDTISIKTPTRAMSVEAVAQLEEAGWRCRIQQERSGEYVEFYVNETLEQFNERQRVSEVSDPKPGALKFGALVRLKHDPTRKRPDGVEVGEIGVVTGSDAWECGTGSSNYVSFPGKGRFGVSPRNEVLLSYPAQLELVEMGSYALGEPVVGVVEVVSLVESDPAKIAEVVKAAAEGAGLSRPRGEGV